MVVATRSAVTAYAEAVTAGDVVTGRLVKLACERHIRDLATGHERGLWFDDEAADWVIQFYSLIPHVKAEWATDPKAGIDLQPWQIFIIGSLFGWKRADGARRFRTSYVEVARKNGKSTLMAPLGLVLAFYDNEPGAEVYSAATTRDQAKIVWSDARAMVLKRPQLRRKVQAAAHSLHSLASNSLFRPLAAEADNLDGLNIHGAIVDELHAHPNRRVVDVLETATGARRQPLISYITTAGFDRNSVCWNHHDYSQRVLEGQIEDDTWFCYVANLDDGDSWQDPTVWAKANPNLGVSVKLDDLERKAARAAAVPSEQNEFRRKHCNEWTESSTRWLDLDRWDAIGGTVDATQLEGRVCYGGLDLSSTTDTTALTLVFPDDAGGYDVLSYAWLPEDNIRQRADRDRVPYGVWADQGFLELTDGTVVDYDHVEAAVKHVATRYQLRELAIDRWNSTGTQTRLMAEGITVVPFGQGFASMNAPAKELEKLVLEGKLRHGGNPILRWAASNVVIQSDAAGNIKPAKDKSTGRIDPIVALVMALGRATVHRDDPGNVYVRERRGLVIL
jgi:phage terminase large subunit-like protein